MREHLSKLDAVSAGLFARRGAVHLAVPDRRSFVGPYQLLAKIGEGGMGTVHLAKLSGPAGFNKLAVVKELRPDMARSPEFMEMFLNEARLAARLTHPNVVHTYGADEHEGCLYIAMEYLDGQPWVRVRHRLWANQSLPLALHLHVMAELLSGLHYAHEVHDFDGRALQVVHCDVSPHNVFVTYDGQVKIVDFGVARAVISNSQEKELFVGKLSYAAPEQVRRQPLDRRADLFAVGVMLWEALAGRRFAEGKDKAEIMRRRVSGAEPRIREIVPTVPLSLASMCDRALSVDPERRFATAADFREAILDYLASAGQRIDNVQVGKLVASAFREERDRVHRLIEQNVISGSSGVPMAVPDLDQGSHLIDDTQRADLSEFVSVSRLSDDRELASAVGYASIRPNQYGRASSDRRFLIAGLALALAALVFAIVLFSPTEDPVVIAGRSASTVAPSASAPTTGPASSAGATAQPAAARGVASGPKVSAVSIIMRARPTTAVLYLDGVELPGNPYELRVAPTDEAHVVSAVGPRMRREDRRVVFDRGQEIAFDLAQAPPSGVARAGRARPRVEASSPALRVPERQLLRRDSSQVFPRSAQPAPRMAASPRVREAGVGASRAASRRTAHGASADEESSISVFAPMIGSDDDGDESPQEPAADPGDPALAPVREPNVKAGAEPSPRRFGRLPAGEIYEEAPY